jgi:hypothetical protein
VQVALSGAGDVAWVTAQVGDQVLALRSTATVTDPGHALAASSHFDRVPTTGLALVEGGEVHSHDPGTPWSDE